MTSIWIDDVVVGEKDGQAVFVVRLDAPASAQVTVHYQHRQQHRGAQRNDYVTEPGTLTFAPGETVMTVPRADASTTTSRKARRCSP